uniref:G-protein coupled receptor 126 n=1 Tax=Melanaphis sacchari TaxID=742174 RepID=A0A2H8TRW3_9HEMI
MKTNNIRIHLIIATFILIKSWIAAIEVQNQNINNLNKSDELTCQKTFEYDFSVLQHCYDDSNCKKYGDCCRDSKFYNESEQTVAISGNVYKNSLYGCSGTGGKDMLQALMINRCPQEASLDQKIRDRCEERANDFLSANPVSSNYSGHVYKNIWCAWCNGEREQVDFLRLILFRCHYYFYEFTQLLNNMWLRTANDQWYYFGYPEESTNSMDHFCEFRIEEIHATTPSFPSLRNCVNEGSTEIVDGCPNGTSTAEAKACASYTYIVFENQPSCVRANRVFRNPDCALCNGLTTDQLTCEPTKPLFTGYELQLTKKQYQRNDCSTVIRNIENLNDICVGLNYYDVAFSKDEYDKYTIENWTEYVYPNSTREYPTSLEMGAELINFTFKAHFSFLVWNDYVLSLVMYDVIVWGMQVSVAALITHLLLFVWDVCRANSEPKNLPEKNLASLSVALLIGYAGMLFIKLNLGISYDILDVIWTVAVLFGLLPAVAWMFVMSVDMWLVLHTSTKKLRVVGGQRYGRFVVYSLFAWLVPTAIIMLYNAAPEYLWNFDIKIPDFHPQFEEYCWIENPLSKIVMFIPPVKIACAVNCLLFLDTIRLIINYDKSLKSAVSSDDNHTSAMVVNRTPRNLKCFLRLSLMMGPTWMFTLLGVIIQSIPICIIITTLNSLQGVFIFIAFDCNQDTLHKLAGFRKHPTVSETQQTTTNMPLIATRR